MLQTFPRFRVFRASFVMIEQVQRFLRYERVVKHTSGFVVTTSILEFRLDQRRGTNSFEPSAVSTVLQIPSGFDYSALGANTRLQISFRRLFPFSALLDRGHASTRRHTRHLKNAGEIRASDENEEIASRCVSNSRKAERQFRIAVVLTSTCRDRYRCSPSCKRVKVCRKCVSASAIIETERARTVSVASIQRLTIAVHAR